MNKKYDKFSLFRMAIIIVITMVVFIFKIIIFLVIINSILYNLKYYYKLAK